MSGFQINEKQFTKTENFWINSHTVPALSWCHCSMPSLKFITSVLSNKQKPYWIRSILLTVPSMHFVALKTARHAQFCCRVWARQRLQSHDTIPESHTILKMADYYNRSGIPTKSWHQPQLYYWTCFQFPRITKGVQGFLLTVWIATILA